ncbi:MAG: UDP-N-acetylmuramate dehydrogenase [Patescibacteria group bacterium]
MAMELTQQEPLARHTSFAIGGPAKLFIRVRTRKDLLEAATFVRKEGMPYTILGGGSNVLISDRGFDGIVIKNEDRTYSIDGTGVVAVAGVVLAMLVHETAKVGLSGLEWAFGVPGTVGGAVRGNAGAFGGETGDVLDSAEIIDLQSGEVKTLMHQELGFAYRRSACAQHPEWLISQATYHLTQSNPAATLQRVEECLAIKKKTQPLGARCIGSMFKNTPLTSFPDTSHIPEEYVRKGSVASGYLIEHVGLKGYCGNNVMISEKHANFFINTGGACCQDVIQLIDLAKKKVFEKYGIHLCEEIQYIGN